MTVLGYNAPATMDLSFDRLPRWAKALGQAAAGTANADVFLVGDNMTAGIGAFGTNSIGARPYSYPPTFVTCMAAQGVSITDGGFFSDQNMSGSTPPITGPQYDPRVVFGSGWSTTAGNGFAGGSIYNGSTTNALSFTPLAAFDTIDVYYFTNNGVGSTTVDVDGGTVLGTINYNQATGTRRVSYTCSLGKHTVNVRRTAGDCFMFGIMTSNSATPGLRMFQLAHVAGGAASLTNQVYPNYNLPSMTTLVAPALTIINIGAVDWFNNTAMAAFSASVQIIITNAKAVGDVILTSPPPSALSSISTATQTSYVNALIALAVSNNIPFLDLHQRWLGGYETLQPLGYYSDVAHPNAVGYNDMAGFFARSLAISSALRNPGASQSVVNSLSMISAFIFG